MRRIFIALGILWLLLIGIALYRIPGPREERSSRNRPAPGFQTQPGTIRRMPRQPGRTPLSPPDFRTNQNFIIPEVPPPPPSNQENAGTRDYPSPEKSIVLNEIQYHPPGEDPRDEWLELYNRGNRAVDLGGWKFTEGIQFEFPPGSSLESGEYLVLCADVNRIRTAFLIENILGNWTGSLSDKGGTIRLVNGEGTDVQVVHYESLPPFPILADGTGSSLELRSPHIDTDSPGNWGASSASGWNHFRTTGEATSNRIYLYLLGAGTVLVDDLSLRPLTRSPITMRSLPSPTPTRPAAKAGTDVCRNGGFESGIAPWQFYGNHSRSRIHSQIARSGRSSLQIVATSAGSTRTTSVTSDQTGIIPGREYLLEFWAYFPEPQVPLIVRLSSSKEGSGIFIKARPSGSTPGGVNSLLSDRPPPFIFPVSHSPRNPSEGSAVTIQARVHSWTGLKKVTLHYQEYLSRESEETAHLLGPEGSFPDQGLYSGKIGPFPKGSLISYYVTAEDEAGGTGRFPFAGNPTQRFGFLSGAEEDAPGIPTYHIFLSRNALSDLQRNPRTDAYRLGVFVHEGRAYFDVGFRYRGQTSRYYPKHHWKVKFNKDNPFSLPGTQGQHTVTTVNLNSFFTDKSYLREHLGYRLLRDLGESYCETWPVRFVLNGSFYGLYLHLENPGSGYLARNGLKKGWLWKAYSNAQGPGGGFELKSGDAETAGAVLDAFLREINSRSGDDLASAIREHLDVNSLTNYLAACQLMHQADAVEKNYLLYADPDGKFRMLAWDLDLTHGRNFECNGGGILNDHMRHDMWDRENSDDALLFGTRVHPKCDYKVNGIIDAFLRRTLAFRESYYERLAECLADFYHPDVLIPKVERLAAEIYEDALQDRRRWPSFGGDSDVLRNQEHLKNWIRRRFEYLRGKLEDLGYRVPDPLNPDFEPSRTAGTAPLAVTFENFSAGKVVAYRWDFGDGETSLEEEPTHTYKKPGCYSVTLKLTNPAGRMHTIIRRNLIHVLPENGAGTSSEMATQKGG